jgi:hypothetical protein
MADEFEPETTGYVQAVPDKCDRIVWRGRYYHLPLDATRAAPPPEPSEAWRPIETAPKDGTLIDIWTGNAEFPQRVTDVSWRKPSENEFWANGSDEPSAEDGTFSGDPGWFDCLGFKFWADHEPTHWMPLPQPPAIAALRAAKGGNNG